MDAGLKFKVCFLQQWGGGFRLRMPDKKNYPGKYMRNFQNTRDNTLYIYVYYKRKMKALIDAVLKTYGWIKIDPFLPPKGLTLIPFVKNT